MALAPEQTAAVAKMEENSIFRLVSTGVDADNRIAARTPVQIQHVDSKCFIIQDQAKFKVAKPEEDMNEFTEATNEALVDKAKVKQFQELTASEIRKSILRSRSKRLKSQKAMSQTNVSMTAASRLHAMSQLDKELLDTPQNPRDKEVQDESMISVP